MAIKFKIGVDFDNTIAWYDKIFFELALEEGYIDETLKGKGKIKLRDHLRRQHDGETIWMKLQGLVYGKYMHQAEMMPGLANFLLQSKARNHIVFIVSHKTEYGHFDTEKISLRREAMKWMKMKRFFDLRCFGISKKNVVFADTREEKAEIIARLGCQYFIDDLPEVFLEAKFPAGTRKLLLSQFYTNKTSDSFKVLSSWKNISNHLLGPATNEEEALCANLMAGFQFKSIKSIPGRGNSRIQKAVSKDGKRYVLKHYPNRLVDMRPRLKREFQALQFLRHHNVYSVPKAVRMDEDLNMGLYEWIEGKPVTRPVAADLQQAVDLIKRLHTLSRDQSAGCIELASEACLCAFKLIGQVEERRRRVYAVREGFPGLSGFLEQTFEPLWEEVRERSLYFWPVESRDDSLPIKKQTLSPSDFGFHNAIKEGGKITFIDFEYFGWDDPVKLTADFLWHPAMDLCPDIAEKWVEAMQDLFSGDTDFATRLQAAMPLYGMRWAMIVLNEFLPGFTEWRSNASGTDLSNLENSQNIQLGKSQRYCKRVERLISTLRID